MAGNFNQTNCDCCPDCCPIKPWPPAVWPVDDFAEMYHVEAVLEYRVGGVLRERQTWSGDITAGARCTWTGNLERTIEDYDSSGDLCDDTRTPTITVNLVRVNLPEIGCAWAYQDLAYLVDDTTLAGSYTLTPQTRSAPFLYETGCIYAPYSEVADIGFTSFVVS